MTPISRSAAIADAGALLAAARTEMHEVYQREGADGVARRACPAGSDEERERLARLYEDRQREDRATRRRGAA